MVSGLLWRASRRHLWRHRAGTLLALLGVALGVALVVAVDLARDSASREYRRGQQWLSGGVSHQLLPLSGGLDERLFSRLVTELGLVAAPLIEAEARLDGQSLTLLGVDPVSELGLHRDRDRVRGRSMGAAAGSSPLQLMTRPDSAWLDRRSAARAGLKPGARFTLQIAGRPVELLLSGLIDAPLPLVICDIATAQEIVGQPGRLDRIDLKLDAGQQRMLADWLPDGVSLVAVRQRLEQTLSLSRAFEVNLQAMGLLAMLVGAFLVYNGMAVSVLQRRPLWGMLRCLGATRGELGRLILGEALVLGLAGSLLGLLLGWVLARGLLPVLGQAVSALYYPLVQPQLSGSPLLLLKGLLLGGLATLAAAAVPAWEAASSAPRLSTLGSRFERVSIRRFRWLALGGGLLIALGLLLAWVVPLQGLLAGFVALFLVVGGYALLLPWLLPPLLSLTRPALRRLQPPVGRLALGGVLSGLSRSGPAVAALTLALATTLGMGYLVDSFRTTLDDWLGQTLQGDLYLSIPEHARRGGSEPLPETLASAVSKLPGVRGVSWGRWVPLQTDSGPLRLLAISTRADRHRGFRFKGRVLPDLWSGLRRGELLLVSEPFAQRRGLAAGDPFSLPTPGGAREFRVGGVFYDYASEQGLLVIDQDLYRRLWRDERITSLALYLDDPGRLSGLRPQLQSVVRRLDPRIEITSNQQIRENSMALFERTFAVTVALRLLVVLVAFVGVLGALTALQLERERDHALLRACGLTPGQLNRLVLLQTGLLGLLAGLLALPLGWLMGELLLGVVNLRAFGWSLQPHYNPWLMLQAPLLGLAAALLAGLYPAWRLRRQATALVLREE